MLFHEFQWFTFCYFLHITILLYGNIWHLSFASSILKYNTSNTCFLTYMHKFALRKRFLVFLNTYKIWCCRGFITKWTFQWLNIVSSFFKYQTPNCHDFFSVWSFHRHDNVRGGSHRKHEFYGQVSFTSEM